MFYDSRICLPINLYQLEQFREIQYILTSYLFLEFVQTSKFLILKIKIYYSIVNHQNDLINTLDILVYFQIFHSFKVLQSLLALVKLILRLSGVFVVIHPFAVEVGETTRQAMPERYVIESSGPELLEIDVQDIVKVGYYLS